jgi:hypothetical protein
MVCNSKERVASREPEMSQSDRKKTALLALIMCLAGPTFGDVQLPNHDEPTMQPTTAKPKSIYEIRDAIQAANDRDGSGAYEGVIPFLGDQIEAVHEPRFPNDGIVSGKKLAKSLPYEHRVHDAMMENRHMDVTFTVKGDNQILVKGQLTGKLRYDGSQLVHPVNIVWTFEQGRLVRIWVDASTPQIMDGYRRQHEAMTSPAVRPLFDQWMEALKEP